MPADFRQTWAIIRLNFNRLFVKGYSKYSLLLVTGLTVLMLVVAHTEAPSDQADRKIVIKGNTSETMSLLFYEKSTMDSKTLSKLQPVFDLYQISPIARDDYVSSGYGTFLLTFQSPTRYTIGTLQNTAIEKIYDCVTSRYNYCQFLDGELTTVAQIKFVIDSALSGQAASPSSIDFKSARYSPALPYAKYANAFQNNLYMVFFIILGVVITSGLIEDRTKGIKFGLFMTGVKRSSYYIGFFFLPVALIVIYSAITMYANLISIQSSDATGPVFFLLLFSAIGIMSAFLLISQITKTTRSANTLIFLYMLPAFASCSGVYGDIASKIPYALHWLFCINPAYAFGLYGLIITKSPIGAGFSSMRVPYYLPSGNYPSQNY